MATSTDERKTMTRIGMIREAIVKAGGRPNFYYYVDGPRSGMGPSHGHGAHKGCAGDNRVSYKVEHWSDGLTLGQREAVVEELAKLPGVVNAYLTRPIRKIHRATPRGHNIKVIFADRAR